MSLKFFVYELMVKNNCWLESKLDKKLKSSISGNIWYPVLREIRFRKIAFLVKARIWKRELFQNRCCLSGLKSKGSCRNENQLLNKNRRAEFYFLRIIDNQEESGN